VRPVRRWALAAVLAAAAGASVVRTQAPVAGQTPPREGLMGIHVLERLDAPDSSSRLLADAPAPAAATTPLPYAFFPQAGNVSQDLILVNYVDLDATTGIRDYACSDYTYDGHQGHDAAILSFKLQDIGVPIFAVMDGTVAAMHDGEFDRRTDFDRTALSNYVWLDHGGGHQTRYYHFKKDSITVQLGQRVTAGTQLGLTGSSGPSSGPHLHFESTLDGVAFEPSAGACRPGASSWVRQVDPPSTPTLDDVTFSLSSFDGNAGLPFDEAVRARGFTPGTATAYTRLQINHVRPNSTYRFQFVRPDGSLSVNYPGAFNNSSTYRWAWFWFYFNTPFNVAGNWRLRLFINDVLIGDAPFTVASSSSALVNRAPNPITVALDPAAPREGDAPFCRVQSTSYLRDPDYDIVRYRYVWTVDGVTKRDVTTAAMSDAIAKGSFAAGSRITCAVTPSDGVAAAATAQTSATAAGGSVTIDRTAVSYAAVRDTASLVAQTPAQIVRLTVRAGAGVTWTATSDKPWLTVTPASGSASSALSVGVKFDATLPASGTVTGNITLALAGTTNTIGPIAVSLALRSPTAAVSPPFGSFDTPVGDNTVLAGSVALTGWTLDNIGVKQVEIWRNLQPGEPTPPFNGAAGDPRTGKIFIANATFVDGARPDVEALNPTTPANYRAGWGYLMLTWGLYGQGNGTYTLHAFGLDQEGNTATIGTKTVIISNNTATRPFGSIDTPAIGGDASGPNFGWGLTPKVNGVATCKIQPSGVQVSIDSGPLQPVVYGSARADIAGAFPGFSNTAAAGGHFIVDWTTLANGPHTIGWLITDDCNRADGVGSRFFNVTGGTTALTAPESALKAEASSVAPFRLKAEATAERDSGDVLLSRGYGELPVVVEPGPGGSRTIEVKQGERIELRLPRGFDSAYQLGPVAGRRALPIGSTWDASGGIFYWQPAPGFRGRYRFVFSNGRERVTVRVLVVP
jgi:hypothetical protein